MRAKSLIRQERISTIGHLSSSIVHDLRNPLAAIYGGAEMLVDGNLAPAHVKRLAANIYHASQRIQRMLQDLLNVSCGKSVASEPCRLGGGLRITGRDSRIAWRDADRRNGPGDRTAAGARPHGARLCEPDRQRHRGHA
jgi:hypothetical protein